MTHAALQTEKWNRQHILVIDDDERIRMLLSRYLEEHDFLVTTACDAQDALAKLETLIFDLLILDIMMPGEDGLSLTRKLKNSGNKTPILLLTALGEVDNRIDGFEAGADDYLPKPFEPKELLVRTQAILRRTEQSPVKPNDIRFGTLTFNADFPELQKGEKRIALTSVEHNLLTTMLRKSNQIISREELCSLLNMNSGERTIDVQVTRLRKKIEDDPKMPRYLQTVRGKGYILRPDV